MDKNKIESVLDRLEVELQKRDAKYVGDFAETLKILRQSLCGCETSSGQMTARGDELDAAHELERLAQLLEDGHHEAEA